MTTISILYAEYTYILSDDPYHLTQEGTDGWTNKNRQTIAVTLHLRFGARVNNNYYDYTRDICILKHTLDYTMVYMQ